MNLVPFRKASRDGRFWPHPDASSVFIGMNMQCFRDTDEQLDEKRKGRVIVECDGRGFSASISEMTGEWRSWWLSHPDRINWDEYCDKDYLNQILPRHPAESPIP